MARASSPTDTSAWDMHSRLTNFLSRHMFTTFVCPFAGCTLYTFGPTFLHIYTLFLYTWAAFCIAFYQLFFFFQKVENRARW